MKNAVIKPNSREERRHIFKVNHPNGAISAKSQDNFGLEDNFNKDNIDEVFASSLYLFSIRYMLVSSIG